MFSRQELKELAAFTSDASPVLSVYLNVDPTQMSTEQYRLALKGMLRSVADKAALPDIEAIEHFVDLEYNRQGKGLLLFSCAELDFWRSYSLAIPVNDEVYVSSRPFVKQMADLLDAYDRYGVVMVDREEGHLYLFYLGALQNVTDIVGENLRDVVHDAAGRGGRSGRGGQGDWTANLNNRLDQVANRNLRDVVELTQRFTRVGQCQRIILAGTDKNRARFMSLLPKDLQAKVVGGFAIDPTASVRDVLDRSIQVIDQSVSERKATLVKGIITAAHKGIGSIGLTDTILAVQEQRVQTLAIQAGFSAPGYICDYCAYITDKEMETCSICGGHVHQVDDIVDELVHSAILNDAEIAFVQDDEFIKVGSIGALWRF